MRADDADVIACKTVAFAAVAVHVVAEFEAPSAPVAVNAVVMLDLVQAAFVRSLEYSARFVRCSSLTRALTVPSVLNSIGRSKWGLKTALAPVSTNLRGDDESVACAQSA